MKLGCYAGSEDSYTAFKDFFDKIIEERHGHGPAAEHVSDMDASELQCPPFLPNEEALIK